MLTEYHSRLARLGKLNPPATEEAIELAERQNMCRFPDSYKEFLMVCNGFSSTQVVVLQEVLSLEGLNTAYQIRLYVPALLLIGTTQDSKGAMLDLTTGAIYSMSLSDLGLPGSATLLAPSIKTWLVEFNLGLPDPTQPVSVMPEPPARIDVYLVKRPASARRILELKNLLALPQTLPELAQLHEADLPHLLLENVPFSKYERLLYTYNKQEAILGFTSTGTSGAVSNLTIPTRLVAWGNSEEQEQREPVTFDRTTNNPLILELVQRNEKLLAQEEASRRKLGSHAGYIEALAFSIDGKYLASGSWDNTGRIWEMATSAATATSAINEHSTSDQPALVRTLVGHSDFVHCVAFSTDTCYVVTGSTDTTAILWERESGRPLITYKGHRYGINSVAFSPDNKELLTGSADQTGIIWDTFSGEKLAILKGHKEAITQVAFGEAKDKDGGKYALTGSLDSTVCLWDRTNGALIHKFGKRRGSVTRLAFTSDGKYIVIGREANWISIWNRQNNQLIYETQLTSSSFFKLLTNPTSPNTYLVSQDYNVIYLWSFQQILAQTSLQGGIRAGTGTGTETGKSTSPLEFSYRFETLFGVGDIYWLTAKRLVVADRGGSYYRPRINYFELT